MTMNHAVAAAFSFSVLCGTGAAQEAARNSAIINADQGRLTVNGLEVRLPAKSVVMLELQ